MRKSCRDPTDFPISLLPRRSLQPVSFLYQISTLCHSRSDKQHKILPCRQAIFTVLNNLARRACQAVLKQNFLYLSHYRLCIRSRRTNGVTVTKCERHRAMYKSYLKKTDITSKRDLVRLEQSYATRRVNRSERSFRVCRITAYAPDPDTQTTLPLRSASGIEQCINRILKVGQQLKERSCPS